MITREQLVEMFAQTARDTDWDPAKPMLWGYFFTDSDKTKLERVTPHLGASTATDAQIASSPRTPFRKRTDSSTGVKKIFTSPI